MGALFWLVAAPKAAPRLPLNFRMKRENRILKHSEFSQIISSSPFLKTTHFVVHYRKNDSGKIRIGINVGKKNGNAVTRNKIKRQIRTLVNESLDFRKPFDIIILVRSSYLTDNYGEAKKEISELWGKIAEKNIEKEN